MKKLLKFLLIICIISTCIPVTSAETTMDTAYQTENMRVLADLKIIPDMESFDLSAPVNRGTFSQYICNLLNSKSSGNTSFADVVKNTEFYTAVSYLADIGVVSGNTDGNFKPYDYIKADHAVKMLVEALGYNTKAYVQGGYTLGYYSVAKKIGLLDGVEFKNEIATLGELSDLLYNSLFVALCDMNIIGDDKYTFTPSEDTVLSRYHNIYSDEGVVTANEYTGLDDLNKKVNTNCIVVNGVTYNSTQAVHSLIGYDVVVFFQKDTLELKTYRKTADYTELIIDADDVVNYNPSNGKLSYYMSNGNTRDITVGSSTDILVNGGFYEGILQKDTFKPDCGEIKLLDNNGDNKYDVCFITSYVVYVVDSTPGTSEMVVDKIGVQEPLKLKEKNYKVVNSSGEIGLNSLKEYDVLMVAPQYVQKKKITQDGNTIEVDVCDTVNSEFYNIFVIDNKIAQGTVSKVTDDNCVVIDDKEYEISKEYIKYSTISNNVFLPVSIGSNFEYLLDSKGRIVYASKVANSSYKYGWLCNVKKYGSVFDEKVGMQIYDSDGNMGVYELNAKVDVTKQWNEDEKVQTRKVDATDLMQHTELFVDSVFKEQLIKFSIDNEGKIIGVALAMNNVSDANISVKTNIDFTIDRVVAEGTGKEDGSEDFVRHHEPKTFDCTYEIANSTIIFDIPVGSDNKNYYAVNKRAFGNDKAVQFIHFYSVKDTGEIGVIVKFTRYAGDSDRGNTVPIDQRKNSFVFDSLSRVVNENGEPCYQLNGYMAGKLVKYYVANDNLLSNERTDYRDPSTPNDPNSRNPDLDIRKLSELKVTDLKPGDQLLLETSRDVEVLGFLVLAHDIGTKKFDEAAGTNYDYAIGVNYYGVMEVFCGTVNKKVGNYAFIDTNHTNGYLRRMRPFDYYYCLDTKTQTVSLVSSHDLMEDDFVYAYITYGNYKSVVIVR